MLIFPAFVDPGYIDPRIFQVLEILKFISRFEGSQGDVSMPLVFQEQRQEHQGPAAEGNVTPGALFGGIQKVFVSGGGRLLG